MQNVNRKDILLLIVLPNITIKSEKYNKRKLPYNITQKIKSTIQNKQAAHVNEFAEYTHQITNKTKRNKTWNPSKSVLHHKLRISKFSKQKDDFYAKRKSYRLIFQDDMNLYKTIMKEIRKLGQWFCSRWILECLFLSKVSMIDDISTSIYDSARIIKQNTFKKL